MSLTRSRLAGRFPGAQEKFRENGRPDVLGDHQGVAQVEGRGFDGAAEEQQGIIEEIAVVRGAAAVGHDHRHPLLTTGSPGPLPVVRRTRRHVAHQGHVQGPDIDAHLQGRRGDQAIRAAMFGFEILLDLVADLAGHLGRVFLGADHHEGTAHQPHVVVFLVRRLRYGRAVAVVPGAGPASGRSGGQTLAGRAAFPDIALLHHELLGVHLPRRHVPRAFLSASERHLREELGFVGQELPQHRGGRIHVESFGTGSPFFQEGLHCRGALLGDQATGILVVLARREQQAFGAKLPERQQPGLDVRIVLGW